MNLAHRMLAYALAAAGLLAGCGSNEIEIRTDIPDDPQARAMQEQMMRQLQSLQGRSGPPPAGVPSSPLPEGDR